MSTLTVIPAVFRDPEKALAEMVDAKRALDAANHAVVENETKTSEKLADAWAGKHAEISKQGQALHVALTATVVTARAKYDISFAIYQETARARDAAAANAHARAVSNLTRWITLATIAQAIAAAIIVAHTIVTWSKP